MSAVRQMLQIKIKELLLASLKILAWTSQLSLFKCSCIIFMFILLLLPCVCAGNITNKENFLLFPTISWLWSDLLAHTKIPVHTSKKNYYRRTLTPPLLLCALRQCYLFWNDKGIFTIYLLQCCATINCNAIYMLFQMIYALSSVSARIILERGIPNLPKKPLSFL